MHEAGRFFYHPFFGSAGRASQIAARSTGKRRGPVISSIPTGRLGYSLAKGGA
jgi:hypothetical protein